MSPKSPQNQEDPSKSAVTNPVKAEHNRSEPVSGDAFVKAMTSIRRSFGRVKEAVTSGELEAIRQAVEKLGKGMERLQAGRRG